MRTLLRSAIAAGVAASAAATGLVLTSGANGAPAATFAGGELVVYRVGDGTTPLTAAAAPVFLDTYGADGTRTKSAAAPTTTSGGQHRLTASGTSASEGEISRSADGHYIVFTGYDAAVGGFGPSGSPQSIAASDPTSVGRVVGRLDSANHVDTSTVLTGSPTPQIIRSAATTNGNQFWVAGGSGGVLTASFGAVGAPTVAAGSATSNINGLSVQGGQLFASATNGPAVATVGTGTPSSGASLTALSGLPADSGASGYALTYGYALLDLTSQGASGTKLDTLYAVNAAERAGAVDKYQYNGTTWTKAGSVDLPGAFGLVATASGTTVSIAVSTPTGISTLTDNGTASSFKPSSGPSVFATAPTGTQFRGIALAPSGTGTGGVPAGQIGVGKVAFTDSRVKHSSAFSTTAFSGAPGGHGLKTTKTGTVKFTYYGRTLVLHLGARPNAGKVKVVVGSTSRVVNLYGSKSSTVAVTFGPSALGSHPVTITALHQKSSKSTGFLVLLGWLEIK